MKPSLVIPLGWVKTAALLAWYLGVWPTIVWFGMIQFTSTRWLQVAAPMWIAYSVVITVALILSQVQSATPAPKAKAGA